MFASNTLLEHLLRGAIGLTALALAFLFQDVSLFVPIVLVPIGLLALKGCPMCWTLGLGETHPGAFQATPAGRPVVAVDE